MKTQLTIADAKDLNYTVTLIKIPFIERVPNSDKLLFTTINEQSVIVNDSYEVDELVLFFPTGTRIKGDFLSYMNAYRSAHLNQDPNQTGYFEDNGRVKMIKLCGTYSEGFICKMDLFMGYLLKEDMCTEATDGEMCPLRVAFDHLPSKFNTVTYGNKVITLCKKFIVNHKVKQPGANLGNKVVKKTLSDQIVEKQFRHHVKVARMGDVSWKLIPENYINVSCKYHGTSGISANVLVKRPLNFWEKLLKRWNLGKPIEHTYKTICSSRTVIKTIDDRKATQKDGFYKFDIWTHVHNQIKECLVPGLTLYYEIVGYLPNGSMIQKGYDYGCKMPEHEKDYILNVHYKVFVYRITMTDTEGYVLEYPFSYIEHFCYALKDSKIHINSPKVYFDGYIKNWWMFQAACDENMSVSVMSQELYKYLSTYYHMEQHCPYCTSTNVPFEGYIIRFEGRNLYEAYKLKAKIFALKESQAQDAAEENMEDAQDNDADET